MFQAYVQNTARSRLINLFPATVKGQLKAITADTGIVAHIQNSFHHKYINKIIIAIFMVQAA